jgi:hypothetical protein
MTTAVQLLRAAERLMGKGSSQAKGAWARGAALLTRQATEASLRELWSQTSPDLVRCPARIQLLCLPGAGLGAGIAREVRHTWSLLSGACHHHPYDVAPSSQELLQWIRVAARLDQVVSQGIRNASPLPGE